jgi:aryl-alcohol dehydrogenase-like predicted oxidoreductase
MREPASMQWSRLGLGAGQLGSDALSDVEAERLVLGAIDAGITLIDTARSYGRSEERIGRIVQARRTQATLVTKVGYGIAGVPDWTYQAVAQGIDEALRALKTDCLDAALLHSCGEEILAQHACTQALLDAKAAGKLRRIGYSGENAALKRALLCGHFDVLECSVSLCDQRVLHELLPQARERGITVIAKRALANAPWRFASCPRGDYVEEYWWRWTTLDLQSQGLLGECSPTEAALRFAAFAPGVGSVLVGTNRLEHLLQAQAAIAKGPLPAWQVDALRARFTRCDPGWWVGQI